MDEPFGRNATSNANLNCSCPQAELLRMSAGAWWRALGDGRDHCPPLPGSLAGLRLLWMSEPRLTTEQYSPSQLIAVGPNAASAGYTCGRGSASYCFFSCEASVATTGQVIAVAERTWREFDSLLEAIASAAAGVVARSEPVDDVALAWAGEARAICDQLDRIWMAEASCESGSLAAPVGADQVS